MRVTAERRSNLHTHQAEDRHRFGMTKETERDIGARVNPEVFWTVSYITMRKQACREAIRTTTYQYYNHEQSES